MDEPDDKQSSIVDSSLGLIYDRASSSESQRGDSICSTGRERVSLKRAGHKKVQSASGAFAADTHTHNTAECC